MTVLSKERTDTNYINICLLLLHKRIAEQEAANSAVRKEIFYR
jgi:hypothetical protein